MTDDLQARIAAAIRDAAHYCDGDCGKTETECDAEHPIQVAVWHHGVVADVAGPIDMIADLVLAVVQPPDEELTREEAVAQADDLSNQLYRAEDRVAFVREMLTSRTEPVGPATVLAWLDHQHCPRVESEQQQIKRLTARIAELERHQAGRVTDHTFEGEPGPGRLCQTERFGQTCGAAWEQHEMRDEE